jgi:S-formylglutathione hydrolase FrmB
MEEPLLGRRRMLGLGAGLLGAAALAACAPPPAEPGSVTPGAPDGGLSVQPTPAAVAVTTAPEVEVRTGSFVSAFRPDASTGWSLAAPAPAVPGQQLPVAVFLHGTGSDNRYLFEDLGIQAILQRYLADGGTPFAIASVDGGDTWWHPRADGTDTQSMLVLEFIPRLADMGFDTGRLGLLGLSMGGFGVLLLAGQEKLPGLKAVAAMSPAVWSDYDNELENAFDSPEDFQANDVFALRSRLETVPKRIDCGTDDPLLATVQDYVSGLPGHLEGGFQSGGHEGAYWRFILPSILSFLGRQLA